MKSPFRKSLKTQYENSAELDSLSPSSNSYNDVELVVEQFHDSKTKGSQGDETSADQTEAAVYYDFNDSGFLKDKSKKINIALVPEEEIGPDGEPTFIYDISQLPPSSDVANAAMESGGKFKFTSTEINKLVLQYDKHVLTFLCFLYFLSHLDRGNIGNAKLAGMDRDLRMDGHEFTVIVIIFFVGYILFQWGILLWKILKPNLFAPWVIIGWGVVSTCSSAVKNWKQLLGLRFILGAFEACFSPGIYYYFSFFYQRSEIAKRIGIFQSFSPISSAVSGSIAYGITKHAPDNIAPWRLLFIVEGIPSIVAGIIAFYAISNGPHASRFLTARQKLIASIRTLEQSGSVNRGGRHFDFKEALVALLDIKIWSTTILYFCITLCQTPLPIFLPSIIEGMGYQDFQAQGMTAPPYIVAIAIILTTCYFSDKYMQRAYSLIACMIVSLVGYLLVALGPSNGSRYFGLFLAVPGVYAGLSVVMAWTGDNQGSDSKRGISYVIVHIFGMTGPIVGTTLFPDSDGPRYVKGIWVTTGMVIFIGLFSCCYRLYLARENQKLNEKYGPVSMDEIKKCNDETQTNFRYVL